MKKEIQPFPIVKTLVVLFGPIILLFLTVFGLTTNTATKIYEAIDLWMMSLSNQIYLSLFVVVMAAIWGVAVIIKTTK